MTAYARIVHEIPDQAEFCNYPQPPWAVELHEILGLAATLTDAGYNTGEVVAKVEAIATALDVNLNPDPKRYFPEDLLSLEPRDVADRVRQAGIDLAVHLDIARARSGVDTQLALEAVTSLRDVSDHIITTMRTTFDPALKKVHTAATAGLTPTTDTAALLATGSDTAIKAYRQLLDAITVLDEIANLRLQMANVAGIGSRETPVANFLATADSAAVLDSAQATWRGEIETVQYDLPGLAGSHLARRVKPRLGGRWLALVADGYDVQLTTAAQAAAVVDRAA